MKLFIRFNILISLLLTWHTSQSQQTNLCSDYSPDIGSEYILTAWVQENHPTSVPTYSNTELAVKFFDSSDNLITVNSADTYEFLPSGNIIEGWQRVTGTFIVPNNTSYISIQIINSSSSIESYVDDIRIIPFNGSIKSFIYNQDNRRLTAELDENNYATFYEYDNEGGLVRVKKETEQGIYTIQETRSSTEKSN